MHLCGPFRSCGQAQIHGPIIDTRPVVGSDASHRSRLQTQRQCFRGSVAAVAGAQSHLTAMIDRSFGATRPATDNQNTENRQWLVFRRLPVISGCRSRRCLPIIGLGWVRVGRLDSFRRSGYLLTEPNTLIGRLAQPAGMRARAERAALRRFGGRQEDARSRAVQPLRGDRSFCRVR